MNDLERFRSALSFIPPDDRETWVRMGMAVKSELGDPGFELWNAWSQQADSYNAKDARDVWKGLNGSGGVTAGTLFHEAKARGWRDNGTHQKPTPEELAERRRGAAERTAKEESEKALERAQARQNAEWILKVATPAQANHPYLLRKGVSPVPSLLEIGASRAAEVIGYPPKSGDEPLTGRLLVVPIYVASELSSLEFIDEAGRKSALSGGAKAGGYWAAQPLTDGEPNLLVGEGVATVLSAKMASGIPGVAVLSCGNLEPVARAMRQRFLEAVLVVLADLGKKTGLPNPHAIAAARAVGGRLAVPDFGEDRDPAWTDFNDLALHRSREAIRRAIASAKAPAGGEPRPGNGASPGDVVDGEEWPAPMDPCAYYGIAGEIVKAIEPHTESDPAGVLVQILTSFGLLIGRAAYYQVEGDRHYSNLFVLLNGGTSKGRKGTSWGRVRSIFERVPGWPRVVSGLSSGEGLKWQVRDQQYKLVKGVEELVDKGVSDKRLLVIEPEFGSVLRAVARKGNTLSAAVRSAWDTGTLATLTKNDPITATDTHISIIGHVTVDELRAELTQTDIANGFINRFLFLCVRRSKCLSRGGMDLPESVVQDFVSRLDRAACLAQKLVAVGMTDAGWGIWDRVYPQLSEGAPGLFGAATARAEAQAVRLAMIYALLDEKVQIDAPHLLAALAVWEYGAASAQHVFGGSLGDPVADEILRAVRAAGQEGMTRTQISGLFQRHCSAGRLGAALDLLARRNLVRSRIQETDGRSTEIWQGV